MRKYSFYGVSDTVENKKYAAAVLFNNDFVYGENPLCNLKDHIKLPQNKSAVDLDISLANAAAVLPQYIKEALPAGEQEFSAISKYTLCYDRIYHRTDALFLVSRSEKTW